jgi:hypothetical protein
MEEEYSKKRLGEPNRYISFNDNSKLATERHDFVRKKKEKQLF